MQPEYLTQAYNLFTIFGNCAVALASRKLRDPNHLRSVVGIFMVGKTIFDVVCSRDIQILSANVLSMLGLHLVMRLQGDNDLTNQE